MGKSIDTPQDAETAENPLNPDWATTFTGVAENATSDELRGRLSRVLAGELASPGTYSRATVRQIAELDKVDLEAMQRLLGFVVGDLIIRLEKGSTQEPSIGLLLPIVEAGLITESSNMLAKTWSPAAEDGAEVWFGGKTSVLKITLSIGQSLRIPMTQLTRTGMAVVDLLGRHDEQNILTKLADHLDAANYRTIELGRLISQDTVALPLKRLKPAPAVNVIPMPTGPFPYQPITIG